MALLISGPPDSSTLEAILDRFRARPDSLLVVPTATMAEHLRHSIARTGVVVRPKSIQTIAGFLDAWAPLGDPPTALVYFAMERALARQRPTRFARVAGYPGVIQALAGLFGQVAGSRMPEDIGRLFAEVETGLAAREFAPRHARLQAAAERIAGGDEPLPPAILWHGFFKLSAGELLLATALAGRTDFTISLPEWSGAERARTGFLAKGFAEVRVAPLKVTAASTVFCAATIEREVEEIARGILDEVHLGRPFREIGIILRSRDPYGPLVETTLARFGIPVHGYFIDSLASHPRVIFLSTLVRAALAGWDHEVLLLALRMPVSGFGATKPGDELDFAMREKLPAQGWHQSAGLNSQDRLDAAEWAQRLRALRAWLPPFAVEDRAGMDRVTAWRSSALAIAGWDAAIEATTLAFEGPGKVFLADFWSQVETTLALEPLRVPNVRRNAVHVLDAYEARQWSLPIVFVCGLTERHFPKYHREDPIAGDAVLRFAGLDTAADREREERFLFDLAVSRATVETILSYPRFDEAGQNTLRSFFLPEEGHNVETVVRPEPKRSIETPRPSRLQDDRLAVQHKRLSAYAIESYVQCPFKFFALRTLRLVQRPDAPRDRLDFLLQGLILHDALAEQTRFPLLGEAALEGAFERLCSEKHVLQTYRTEAVRLELLRHFRAFTHDTQLALPGWTARVEVQFDFALRKGLTLRGRIDRLDVDSHNRAVVIDYKYSATDKLKERIEASASGELVQAGLYLLAAERHFKATPAGMFFCHVKNGVKWDGWHASLGALQDIGEARTPTAFAELAQNAEQIILRVHDEIVAGKIDVAPSDSKKCVWCEYRDVCRVETIARVEQAGA